MSDGSGLRGLEVGPGGVKVAPTLNPYETDKLLAEYLLFHYGTAEETLPHAGGLRGALDYPVRCVSECFELGGASPETRALDLGCAVGRSTFELARHFGSVTGIDYSQRFIDAAQTLQQTGALPYQAAEEGALTVARVARPPAGIDRARVSFARGDAMALPPDLGLFDAVLMANLIDRLAEPSRCLAQLPALVRPGGQLVITSPCTWLEEWTPRAHWLGGFEREGRTVTTLDGLRAALDETFKLVAVKDLPFLIREHARKYQWSVAQATTWIRR